MPSKMKPQQRKILYGVIGIALIGVIAWGWATGWTFTSQSVGVETAPSTYINTTVYAKGNVTNDIDDDIDRTWFEVDISEMEIEDIEALTFSDFDQKSSTSVKIDYDSDFIYVLKINGTGFEEAWFCTDPYVADGQMDILAPGDNDLYLYESADSLTMLAFPVNMPNATTANETTYDEWSVNLYAIDGNDEASSKVGFAPYYDFENANDYKTVITFTFNTTITTAAVQVTTAHDYVKVKSGTDAVQFFIDCDYTTGISFTFTLGSGLGSDYELESIAAGTGYEGTVTTAITQA